MEERAGNSGDAMPRAAFERAIVYLTVEDLSVSDGPSVNERETWASLARSALHTVGVMPRPSSARGEAIAGAVRYFSGGAGGRVGLLWSRQIGLVREGGAAIAALVATGENPIVVCRMPFLPWSVLLLMRRFPDVPFFFKTVGDTEFLHRYTGLKRLLSSPLRPLQTWTVDAVLRGSRGLDVCTENLKSYLGRIYRLEDRKVAVIPNATSVDRFDPAVPVRDPVFDAGEFVIGYAGGHPYVRGGKQILETLSALRTAFPRLRGLTVGGDVDKLTAYAQELAVDDICRLVGPVPYQQVPNFMAQVALLIATDESLRSSEIGNSNQKIRQALAMGIPVITNPDCERILIDEGLVMTAHAGDREEIVRLSREVVDWSPAMREEHARRARRFVTEHLSTEATLRQRVCFWRDRLSAD